MPGMIACTTKKTGDLQINGAFGPEFEPNAPRLLIAQGC